jgi:peptide/nickel transport system permease protein
MLEVGTQDYIRTAYSKGLSGFVITRRHQLPNAILPWIILVGLDFGILLIGSIIVETIFAWPGIGSQLIVAIDLRDYPVVQADIFIVGLLVVSGNLMADLCYRWVNPRLRTP